jgi:hypothetical protein
MVGAARRLATELVVIRARVSQDILGVAATTALTPAGPARRVVVGLSRLSEGTSMELIRPPPRRSVRTA